ncbi:cytochrome c [Dokdonella sp.]|uniref:c-type cytochrome n=1 Tax=Dokdonella sp. TaxID=2291710 RepID=UPI0025C0480D|nr:cytochrome c [Dokdonella sp.]MBX3688931.1 cytochrome c [Dokdonella sp.]
MKRTLATFAVSMLVTSVVPAQAAGDIEAGKTKAIVCQACHGVDGNSIDPQYPRLAGQYRDYLQRALHEYREGGRSNAIMLGFAKPLTDQEIEDLAAYFAALPGKLSTLDGKLDK